MGSKQSMSKADEINLLVMWRDEVGDHAYLSSLLSPGLIDWFTAQVHMDLNCDIHKELRDQKQEAFDLAAETVELTAQLAEHEKTISILRELNTQVQKDFEQLEDERDAHMQAAQAWEVQASEEFARVDGLESRLVEAETDLRVAEELEYERSMELAGARQTILELKARLYDLIAKG